MSILQKPIVTEKATNMSEILNRYTFVVDRNANKIEIKKAVEKVYGVSVTKVRTLISPTTRAKKRTKKGMMISKKSSYKKAIVCLVEGDSIDFYNDIN